MARRIGTIMVDMGYLDEDSLWKVLQEQKRSGTELLGKVAVRLGLVNEDQVLRALGEQLGMKVIKLNDVTIPGEMTELVGESMATAYKVVPLSQNKKDKSVTVVMAEPQNPSTLDSLRLFLGVDVKGAVASESDVTSAIERLYAGHHETIQDVVNGKFTGGTVTYALADGGVDLAPFHNFDSQVPQPLKDELTQLKKDVISGAVTVDGALK